MTDRLYEPTAAPRRDWLVTALLVLAAHVAVLALPLLPPSLELLPGHPLLATLVQGPESTLPPASASPARAEPETVPARTAPAPAVPLPVLPAAAQSEIPPLPVAGQPSQAPASPALVAPMDSAPGAPNVPAAPASAGTPSVGQPPVRALETDVDIVCPRQPGAVYPALSQRMGETGRAVVRLELDLSGHIVSRAILQSSGSPRLDKAALAAVDRYQCRPALLDGRPTPATTTQQFDFVIK